MKSNLLSFKLNWNFLNDNVYKKFYNNLRVFDISLKSNTIITKIEQIPNSMQLNVTLPLLPLTAEGNSKLKIILNSLKLVSIFSRKKAYLKRYLTLQWNKKWSQGLIISSELKFLKNFNIISLLTLISFPYIRLSEGISKFLLLSDSSGNVSFSIREIAQLGDLLNEDFIGWNKNIQFNLSFSRNTNNYFLTSPFLKNIYNWLLWSSVGLTCSRGHGSWSNLLIVKKIYKNVYNKLRTKHFFL